MKFNIGDKLGISGDIKITGGYECGDGIFSYNTDIGTTFREPVLDKLVCKTASVKPQGKPKFKAGCKAKVIANTCHHHMMIGDIVTLTDNTHIFAGVLDLPAWHYKEQSPGFISERDLEPYAEPAEPAKEPVKLYCVDGLSDWLTRGKIYESFGGRINVDTGENYTDKYMRSGGKLYPLVSRPAKAGEWVYIAKSPYSSAIADGAVLRVVNSRGSYIDVKGDIDTQPSDGYLWHVIHSDYLVLDGYDGRYEQMEPKFYSGKVVCVWAEPDGMWFTVGKVYEYQDGIVNDNYDRAYNTGNPAKSKDESLTRSCVHFIEYKGEAT